MIELLEVEKARLAKDRNSRYEVIRQVRQRLGVGLELARDAVDAYLTEVFGPQWNATCKHGVLEPGMNGRCPWCEDEKNAPYDKQPIVTCDDEGNPIRKGEPGDWTADDEDYGWEPRTKDTILTHALDGILAQQGEVYDRAMINFIKLFFGFQPSGVIHGASKVQAAEALLRLNKMLGDYEGCDLTLGDNKQSVAAINALRAMLIPKV